MMVTITELLAHLPPEPDEASLFSEIRQAVARSKRKLVVIDDDPTGTQTVHNVELLTTWDRSLLAEALRADSQLFYILTNSRSMPQSDAARLNYTLARQLYRLCCGVVAAALSRSHRSQDREAAASLVHQPIAQQKRASWA